MSPESRRVVLLRGGLFGAWGDFVVVVPKGPGVLRGKLPRNGRDAVAIDYHRPLTSENSSAGGCGLQQNGLLSLGLVVKQGFW